MGALRIDLEITFLLFLSHLTVTFKKGTLWGRGYPNLLWNNHT